MDRIDKLIIMDLLQNCRLSYQALARKHGITLNAIKKRIHKLLSDGVFEFCIEPNVAMFDGDWAIALIKTNGTENQMSFINELGSNRMINEVGTLSDSGYIIYAVYSGLEGFAEFNKYLRSLNPVVNIEVHQILMNRGPKLELTKKQVHVLHAIIDDPRMQLSTIADRTGLSAKTVRRILNELIEDAGIWFGSRLHLNSTDGVSFLVRVVWDENQSQLPDVLEWLSTEFSDEYWFPLISVNSPIIFAVFMVAKIKDINVVIEKLRKSPLLTSASAIMGSQSHSFYDLRRYWLEEKFIETGLPPTLNE
ncbi:MAG: winged helix-turn-helix transcriptional regulator [Candidatus Thorarchaeota archaeon]